MDNYPVNYCHEMAKTGRFYDKTPPPPAGKYQQRRVNIGRNQKKIFLRYLDGVKPV